MVLVSTLLSLIVGSARAQGLLAIEQSAAVEEDRFHEELLLSLDDVRIQPAQAGFSTASMGDQLDAVRPFLEEQGLDAVVWLDAGDAERLRVSVAFVSEARAVIRMLEVPRGAGAEAQLALAVRELLHQAYATLLAIPEAPTVEPVAEEVALPESPGLGVGVDWAIGGLWPAEAMAGGLRGAMRVGVTTPAGPVEIGTGLSTDGRPGQARIGPVLGAGRGGLWLRAGVDRTWLEGLTIWQSRVDLSYHLDIVESLGVEAALRFAPVRDQVLDGETLRYDSGRIEFGLFVGGS